MSQEGLPIKAQQRFGETHPPRFSGGKQNTFNSFPFHRPDIPATPQMTAKKATQHCHQKRGTQKAGRENRPENEVLSSNP
jgi:hypothetical protein